MPNDLTLTTRGLPTPGGATWVDRTFHWAFVGDTLTIPKFQCGQSEFSAKDPEQGHWLDAHGAVWLREVWYCVWEWTTPGARDDFMAILAPLDPLSDEVTRVMLELDGVNPAGRAQAARALLALTRPNLAAAVPVIERALRDADPELRALAAALLYQWHRRTESNRLSRLFRDDDPVIRAAALLQAQCDFYLDPCAREQLPFIVEGMRDGDPAVRHQALQAVEAAAIKGMITSRRVLELRAELGPLVGSDGLDRSDTLSKVADSRGPRAPSAPAMEAFYAALCAVERLRAQAGAPGGDRQTPADSEACAQLAIASELARALWERLPQDAPDEVRLHDTRIDILLGAESNARPPDADLMRRIVSSRSPQREHDAAAIYWIYQHTAPRGLPAEFVRPAASAPPAAERSAEDDDAFERGPFV
jgi:hypothetical protein